MFFMFFVFFLLPVSRSHDLTFVLHTWPLTCVLVKWHLAEWCKDTSLPPSSLWKNRNEVFNPAFSVTLNPTLTILQSVFPLSFLSPSSPPSPPTLSDFHPPSWENRRESSWQRRWGERATERARERKSREGAFQMNRKRVCCFEREHCVLLPHCHSSISVI